MACGDESESNPAGLSPDTSKKVIRAIEETIPLYDSVNDLISFGKAQQARKYAVQELQLSDGMVVLDAGIGPGTTSKLILGAVAPRLLVGLDASVRQLKTAELKLGSGGGVSLQLVRGSFEFLPFRHGVFDIIITCFALRDSLDLSKSIEEYHRVCNLTGAFADVDLGKPDGLIKRVASLCYIRYVMPTIARAAIRGRIEGNPWRMIVPTFESLPTNGDVLSRVKAKFGSAKLREFLSGGLIVIIARNKLK